MKLREDIKTLDFQYIELGGSLCMSLQCAALVLLPRLLLPNLLSNGETGRDSFALQDFLHILDVLHVLLSVLYMLHVRHLTSGLCSCPRHCRHCRHRRHRRHRRRCRHCRRRHRCSRRRRSQPLWTTCHGWPRSAQRLGLIEKDMR